MQKIETLATGEAKFVKKEMRAEDSKDKKMDTIREKRDSLNLDLEKPHQDSGSDCCKFEQHSQKQQLSKVCVPKVEKTGNFLLCFSFDSLCSSIIFICFFLTLFA